MKPRVIDIYDEGEERVFAVTPSTSDPDELAKQMADLNRRATTELEQLKARMDLLRRVVNITDSALHAADTPQQASSEPFGCPF